MDEIKEIEERWNKTSSIYDLSVTLAQVDIWTLLSEVKRLQEFQRLICPNCLQMLEPDGSCLTCRMAEEVKRLREGLGEVLDGTLPYLAEQRLRKLVEKKIK